MFHVNGSLWSLAESETCAYLHSKQDEGWLTVRIAGDVILELSKQLSEIATRVHDRNSKTEGVDLLLNMSDEKYKEVLAFLKTQS